MTTDPRAEAREQIARAIHRYEAGEWDNCPTCRERADAVLAAPAVAAALDVVDRVRALAEGWESDRPPIEDKGWGEARRYYAADLRRALGDQP
jgi:hypothetical protein